MIGAYSLAQIFANSLTGIATFRGFACGVAQAIPEIHSLVGEF